MYKAFFEDIRLVSLFIIILPLSIGIYKYRHLNTSQKGLLYLLIATALTEIISNLLWYRSVNNFPVFHLYTIVQFLLITIIYKEELYPLFSKKFFIIISTCFLITGIGNALFVQSIYTFNSNTITLSGLLIIFFTLAYFYKLLKEIKYSTLERNPMFWLNVGFLIYFSSNLLLFFLNNNLMPNSIPAYVVWSAHAIVNIMLNIFYTIALWIRPEK